MRIEIFCHQISSSNPFCVPMQKISLQMLPNPLNYIIFLLSVIIKILPFFLLSLLIFFAHCVHAWRGSSRGGGGVEEKWKKNAVE